MHVYYAIWFFFAISVEVLVTLTSDVGRILSKLHGVQPKGNIRFGTALKVAHVRPVTDIFLGM